MQILATVLKNGQALRREKEARMKTVYYVIGPMASGKTTSARNLAKRMDIPLFHSDIVYQQIHDALNIEKPADALLDPRLWDNPKYFGLSTWGEYETLQDAKAPRFNDMLAKAEGDFIIEGFSLGFLSERELVESAVGPHKAVLLHISIPYEAWKSFFLSRWPDTEPTDQASYDRLCSYFEAGSDDVVYTFRDPKMIDVHYAPYQGGEFTEKKIEALKIPVQPGDVINDIGCNEGLIGKWCVDQGASNAHGYEYNWRFLDKARDNGLIPHLGNVEHDPLEPADITLCVSVFHYFENPQAFIRKARAATRRLFIIELPIFADPVTRKSVEGLVAKYEPANQHNISVTRYSAKLIETWLWQSFSKIEYVGRSVPPDNSLRYVYHCWV